MSNPKNFKQLLQIGGKRLSTLRTRAARRNQILAHVRAALTPELAGIIVSAGLESGVLTIGVNGGAFAARLRYATDTLRERVGTSLGADIQRVRIRVVPPPG